MAISGGTIMHRLEALAGLTETKGQITRTFLTKAHQASAAQIEQWMRDAGMETRVDAIGNVIGRYEGLTPGLPALVVGSHYDTVRNAGKYDGLYGIVAGISCVEELNRQSERFPFAIEIVGFSEEEGVRFGATLLGSRGFAGTFDLSLLTSLDADGISMAQALQSADLDPDNVTAAARSSVDILAYLEAHIEQGPVLHGEDLPIGIVTSIAGATRFNVTLSGPGGHAGTVPMALRHDPLTAAAELISFIEHRCSQADGLVGTVGILDIVDGATNTIPANVRFTIDIRSGDDESRLSAITDLINLIDEVAARKGVNIEIEKTHEANAAECNAALMDQLENAIKKIGITPRRLVSGAGHDAMALTDLTHIAMLFVRCGNDGISHHPDESMTEADAETGCRVMLEFVRAFEP